MIKNIVFDMGGVLIDFNPTRSFLKYFGSEEDVALLHSVLFSGYWQEWDRGAEDIEGVLEKALAHIPERLHEKLRWLMNNWWQEMPPKPDTFELVRELKEKGYSLYLLSNVPSNFYDYKDDIPAICLLDGVIVSCDWLTVKPEPEIYQILFKTFSLKPEECYFIDDMPQNVAAGEALGMRGHCFSHGDCEILREALRKEGVNI